MPRPHLTGLLLESWAAERRKSIDDAVLLSRISGFVCNNPPAFWHLGLAHVLVHLESTCPSARRLFYVTLTG